MGLGSGCCSLRAGLAGGETGEKPLIIEGHEEREGKAEKNTETRPTEVRSASTEKTLKIQ
jgi:hypothetical protein